MKAKVNPRIQLFGIAAAAVPVAAFLMVINAASPVVALLVYCCIYITVASARPQVGLLLLFASAPWNQDLSHGLLAHFSLSELNLALAFPICLFQCWRRGRPLRLGPISTWVALYFLVCVVSSALAWRNSAVISFLQMGLYLICAVVVFGSWLENPNDYQPVLEAAAAVGVLLAVSGLVTGFTFPALNKNAFGASLANILIIFTELWLSAKTAKQARLLILGLVVVAGALLMTLSRGGWLGAAVGILILFAGRRRFGTMVKLGLILAPIMVLLWITLPQESREYAFNFSASRWNIKARLKTIEITENMFSQSPLFGTGLGVRKEIDATNLALVTLAETGAFGLLTFLGVHLAAMGMGMKTLRKIHDGPSLSVVVLSMALLGARFTHGMVDQYWSRGALMQAWAGVGMATLVYYLVEPERRRGGRRLARSQE